jgi:hypothetical protein
MSPTRYVVNLSCIEGVKIEDYADGNVEEGVWKEGEFVGE